LWMHAWIVACPPPPPPRLAGWNVHQANPVLAVGPVGPRRDKPPVSLLRCLCLSVCLVLSCLVSSRHAVSLSFFGCPSSSPPPPLLRTAMQVRLTGGLMNALLHLLLRCCCGQTEGLGDWETTLVVLLLVVVTSPAPLELRGVGGWPVVLPSPISHTNVPNRTIISAK